MKTNRVFSVVIIFAIICFAFSLVNDARASQIAYEGFGTSGSLDGSTSGSGFASAWSADDILQLGASSIDQPAGAHAASGGHVYANANGSFSADRELSTSLSINSGDTWYVSFTLDNCVDDNAWAMVGLSTGDCPSDGWPASWVGAGAYYSVGNVNNTLITRSSGAMGATATVGAASSSPTMYVMKIVTTTSGNLTAYFDFFDCKTESVLTEEPEDWASSAPLAFASGVTFTHLTLRGANCLNDKAIDEIRIGTTWADVASVPEPSTVVLLASGLIGLLAYAFKRRK